MQPVPPRTRGWSQRLKGVIPKENGSPAHAGMVPSRSTTTASSPGFPRARGDGPTASPFFGLFARVPPRTRGWSQFKADTSLLEEGSPAHAGMVPHFQAKRGAAARFPRARGDGPRQHLTPDELSEVPPRTRGWSHHGQGCGQGHRGSPAHAGMVPYRGTWLSTCRRFPRARGDGPRFQAVCASRPLVPPRTRGWSPSGWPHRSGSTGSPAHAGMVPLRKRG